MQISVTNSLGGSGVAVLLWPCAVAQIQTAGIAKILTRCEAPVSANPLRHSRTGVRHPMSPIYGDP